MPKLSTLTLALICLAMFAYPELTAAYQKAFYLITPQAFKTHKTVVPIPAISPKPAIQLSPLPKIQRSIPPKTVPVPAPAKSPAPTPTPKPPLPPTPAPAPTHKSTSAAPPTTNQITFMISAINNYRATQGLPAVQTDPLTCSFAKVRAEEIAKSFSHDGFSNRLNSKSLPYPSYSLISENIAQTSNYQEVVNLWINSAGHAANMRLATPYVCVANSGDYYAYEGWKP